MSKEILSVFVGLPCYGGLSRSEQAKMMFELGHAFASAEDRFRFAGIEIIDSQPIDRVRNMFLERTRELKADWLLMIDSDCWVDGTEEEPAGFQLLRMISQADRLGDAKVVGAHVIRRDGAGSMTYRESPTSGRMLAITPGFGLEQVSAIGTSIVAIHSSVSDFRYAFAEGLSEDLYFCKQIRDAFTLPSIYVDGRIRTRHMGRPEPRVFDGGVRPTV